MYHRWRFQRHLICRKMLKIRMSIKKFHFFLVNLVRSIQTKLRIDNKTQSSETKNRRVYISLQIIRSRRNKKSFQYLFFLFVKKVFF